MVACGGCDRNAEIPAESPSEPSPSGQANAGQGSQQGAPDSAIEHAGVLDHGIPIGEAEMLRPKMTEIFAFINRKQYGIARVRLRKFEAEFGADDQSSFLFALANHKEKRYGKAKPYFEQAIRLNPSSPTPYYFYAWCLYYLGELDEAARAFELFLTGQPDVGDAYYGLGVIAFDQDRLDDAEAHLKKAILLQFNDDRRIREVAKARARLGDVYLRQERVEEARAELEQAVALWPDHYEAQFRLYRVLQRLGDDEAAAQALAAYEDAKQRVRPDTP